LKSSSPSLVNRLDSFQFQSRWLVADGCL
jgi:hypothetical protein